MAQVASVNWTTKRIYLHADTVTNGFDIIAAHFEIKALAQANAANEQFYTHPMSAEGNLVKSADEGTYTPKFGLLVSGWRLVPYDLVSHELRLLSEIISLDGLVDRDVFDRSSVPDTVYVDITPVYEKIEIREVNTGSGLTVAQAAMIMDVWQRLGLDADNALVMTDQLIQTGTINLQITQPDADTTQVERQ